MIANNKRLQLIMEGNILLAYFSNTGNTEAVATFIASEYYCDIEVITPERDYGKNISEIKKRLIRERDNPPPIKKPKYDIRQYSVVVIGTPVWNNDIPAPVKQYLLESDWRGKKIHPFFSYGGIYFNAYHSLISICKGASFGAPLFIKNDHNGNFIGACE